MPDAIPTSAAGLDRLESPARIGVLSNLRAGQRDSKVDSVLRFLGNHPDVFHLETPSQTDVAPALREMARVGVQILVLNGGDGTIQHALTYLHGDHPPAWQPWIAPISGGRTNMITGDFGGHRDPVKGLAELIEAQRERRLAERVCARAVQRVETSEGTFLGMFLGFGMLHRAVRLVHAVFPEGKARGAFGAAGVTAMLVALAALHRNSGGIIEADAIEIELDGEPFPPGVWRLAMVCTLGQLFLGIRPFWGSESAPLRVPRRERSPQHTARSALGIFRGTPGPKVLPENGYHSHNVHSLTARLDGGLILDGELFEPEPGREVRVTALDTVRFLRA